MRPHWPTCSFCDADCGLALTIVLLRAVCTLCSWRRSQRCQTSLGCSYMISCSVMDVQSSFSVMHLISRAGKNPFDSLHWPCVLFSWWMCCVFISLLCKSEKGSFWACPIFLHSVHNLKTPQLNIQCLDKIRKPFIHFLRSTDLSTIKGWPPKMCVKCICKHRPSVCVEEYFIKKILESLKSPWSQICLMLTTIKQCCAYLS